MHFYSLIQSYLGAASRCRIVHDSTEHLGIQNKDPGSHSHFFFLLKCSMAVYTLTAEDTIKWSYMFTMPVLTRGLSGMVIDFYFKTSSLLGSSKCIS